MLKKDLQKLGLSNKEASVYVACLECGHASTQRIAEKAQIPKSTTYDMLKVLNKRGLVSIYMKKSRKYFTAADPSILKEQLKRQDTILDTIMPQLHALFFDTQNEKPKVRMYEGKQGIRLVLKEVLNEAKHVDAMSSVEDIFKKLPEYFPEFSKERAKRRIKLHLIARDSVKARERQKLGPQELREVKIIHTQTAFRSSIWMWQNKLAMVTLGKDIMVFVIESKDLAQIFQAMFESLWNRDT